MNINKALKVFNLKDNGDLSNWGHYTLFLNKFAS